MEQKLIRFFRCGFAIVARDRDTNILRHDATFDRFEPFHDIVGHGDRVRALALRKRNGDGRTNIECAILFGRHCQGALFKLGCTHNHTRHIFHIDGASITRCEKKKPHIWYALQGLTGQNRQGFTLIAEGSNLETTVRIC